MRLGPLVILSAFTLALSAGAVLAQNKPPSAGSSSTGRAANQPTAPAAPPISITGPAPDAPPTQATPAQDPTGGKPQGGDRTPNAAALGLSGDKDSQPVAVEAEQGIEWQQQKHLYIARGNAKATRGNVTIYGDVLQAYYRQTQSGGSDIWRFEANGAVKITTPSDTAVGDKAVYDVDNAIFVLTGKKLELDTPKAQVTAKDSLEYWQQRQYAVARGNARVVHEDKTVNAKVMTAHFKPDAKGELQVSNVEAFENVVITAQNTTAHALYGDYNLDSGIAILKGQVKITRGADQLDGECAEMYT